MWKVSTLNDSFFSVSLSVIIISVWHFRFYGDLSEYWTKTEMAQLKDAALDSQN